MVPKDLVDFDADGVIAPESVDAAVSGQYATTDETVVDLYGSLDAAFADETRGEVVRALTDAVAEVVNIQDSNVFGLTDVFLEGRREEVRTQETNLGNLTADANLFYSKFYDADVQVSIKNAGGIRAPIGEVADDGTLLPPQGNPASGKDVGEISELDISNSLRFNNELSLLTVTAEELEAILEYGVSATEAGATPGQFPQVGGLSFSFDPTAQAIELDDSGNVVTEGDRLQSVAILDENGEIADILVEDGDLVGDPSREIRLVTLNFLAGGGDGYPFDSFGENQVDLPAQPLPTDAPNAAMFAEPGTEQDALAEYLAANFPADDDSATPVFMMEETPLADDERIQNLSAREDTVLEEDGDGMDDSDFSNGLEGPFSKVGSLLLEEGAEINAYDPTSQTLFVVSGSPFLQVVDLSDPSNPTLQSVIDLGVFGAGVNSVAVNNDVVALAVEARTSTDEGSVVFLTTDGQFLESVDVGAVPDMVTFTPDGNTVLVANEGEPNADYTVDPEGSVSIIDLRNGAENATVMTAGFTEFNDQKAQLQEEGVKLFGPDATVAEDLEPEYIAVSPDGNTAWVTLQENNAVAVVDIATATVQDIVPLGAKDFSQDAQLDASDEDSGINLQNWPVFGLYQPDAIASYETNGMTYYVTANEGDARIRPDDDIEDGMGNVIEEGSIFNEEVRVGDVTLDPEAFPDADTLQQPENLGRLQITNTLGDPDEDGDFDQLFSFGARSFAIWDQNGNLVFDSGDDIANLTAQLTPELFNADEGDPQEFDQRSDNKGAEPEAITVGQIDDTTYAFVGLERSGGGVVIYDITNPAEAEFVQYVRSDEDIAPEGISFIASDNSPTGESLLVVTNEVSNTLAVYAFDENGGDGDGDMQIIPIFDIQGAAQTSPREGQMVSTTGVVTAVDGNGFYLQDATGDGDTATSDAVFIFTDDAPSVTVGDEVNVTGTVSEFFPGGVDTGNLSTTQISGDLTVETLSTGNDLPEAIILGDGGRVPPTESIDEDNFARFNPDTDGIDFFESLEGMRVTAQDAVAIAGTNRFGEIFTAVDGGQGATGLSDRGTLNISPDDFNPERVQIDEDGDILPEFEFPEVAVGAELGDVTGVLSYEFGNFQIQPTEAFMIQTDSTLEPEVTNIMGGDDELTVATYNVLNLDPNESDGDTDIADGRFAAIAQHILTNLNTPDVIGLQEIQDNSGAADDGTIAADQTLQLLVDEIVAAGGPTYEFIDNTFIEDGASGGQPGGNIRTAFLYNPDRVDLVEGSVRPVGTQDLESPFLGARLPLAANFQFNDEEVAIVNNHFSSKGGSAPILGVEQPFEERQEEPDVNGSLDERRAQAQVVNDFVDELLTGNANANVVVLGDLNEFEFISPLEILAGTVESVDDGQDIMPTGADAILTNLVNSILPDERYSFIFQGNSQVLDHILVSDGLLDEAAIDIVHVNTEFAETSGRASDHDPLIASFDFNEADDGDNGNGDGDGNGDDGVVEGLVNELLDLTGFDEQDFAQVIASFESTFDTLLEFARNTLNDIPSGEERIEVGLLQQPGTRLRSEDAIALLTQGMEIMATETGDSQDGSLLDPDDFLLNPSMGSQPLSEAVI